MRVVIADSSRGSPQRSAELVALGRVQRREQVFLGCYDVCFGECVHSDAEWCGDDFPHSSIVLCGAAFDEAGVFEFVDHVGRDGKG